MMSTQCSMMNRDHNTLRMIRFSWVNLRKNLMLHTMRMIPTQSRACNSRTALWRLCSPMPTLPHVTTHTLMPANVSMTRNAIGGFGVAVMSTKGKSKGKGKGQWRPRKPLAQRILESECRRCGAKGHWKAECPLNRASSSSQNPSGAQTSGACTGAVTSGDAHDVEDDMILLPEAGHMHVPQAQVSYHVANPISRSPTSV